MASKHESSIEFCWASIADACPPSQQHWINVLCLPWREQGVTDVSQHKVFANLKDVCTPGEQHVPDLSQQNGTFTNKGVGSV